MLQLKILIPTVYSVHLRWYFISFFRACFTFKIVFVSAQMNTYLKLSFDTFWWKGDTEMVRNSGEVGRRARSMADDNKDEQKKLNSK